jgi:hypothetical protein
MERRAGPDFEEAAPAHEIQFVAEFRMTDQVRRHDDAAFGIGLHRDHDGDEGVEAVVLFLAGNVQRAEARRMGSLLPRLAPPPNLPRVNAALDGFIQDAIGRMVVNGGVLLSAFSPAPRTASSSP